MFLLHMELPNRGNSNVYLQHDFSKNEFYTISFCLEKNSQLLSLFQCNEHVELNKFTYP